GLLPSRTLRISDGHGHFRPVRLWGRVPEGPARTHLIGAVLDTTHGAAAVAAVERLRDGVFALDPEGRVDYANRSLELLLVAQRGYPEGFLDGFEGTSLRARLPGAQTLSTGAPIFFESEHELLAAYPGIPLDEMRAWAFLPLIASGHPVGSCILGFDEPRAF